MTPHTKLLLSISAVAVALTALLWFLLSILGNKCFGATASAQVGQSVTLTVTADGTAPLSYQWAKDGATIDGATLATYVIPSAKLVDAGAYTVTVSNVKGSTTSDTAILTILPMLATLSASVTSINYPAPTLYQWRLNGRTIVGANAPTYTFDPKTAPGSYSITVTFPNPPPLK